MPGTPWTTPEQGSFLSAKLAAFREARAAGTLQEFYEILYDEWFKKWPAMICPDTGKKYKTRLSEWYPNHTKNDGKGVADGLGRRSQKPLPPIPGVGRTRNLSRVQFYWDQYCKPYKVIKAEMKAAFKEYTATTSDDKKMNHLTYQQEWASRRLGLQPQDVQEEVERLWKVTLKPGKPKQEEGATLEESAPSREKLEEYDKNIAAVPATVILWLRQLYQQTGMVGTFLVGGPCPGQQGRIGSFAYDWEFGPEKKTFRGQYPAYDTAVKAAWEAYLHTLWTPEQRLARSLDGTGEDTPAEGSSSTSAPSKDASGCLIPSATSPVHATPATSLPGDTSTAPAPSGDANTTAATSPTSSSPSITVSATPTPNLTPPTASNATTVGTNATPDDTPIAAKAPSTSVDKRDGRKSRGRGKGKGRARDSDLDSDGIDGVGDDVRIGGDSDSWSGIDPDEEAQAKAEDEPVRVSRLKPWEDTNRPMTEYERQRMKTLEKNYNLQVSLGLIQELKETATVVKPKPKPVLRRVDRAISEDTVHGERRQSTRLANKSADTPAAPVPTATTADHTHASPVLTTPAADPDLGDNTAEGNTSPTTTKATSGAANTDNSDTPGSDATPSDATPPAAQAMTTPPAAQAMTTPPAAQATTTPTRDVSRDSHHPLGHPISSVNVNERTGDNLSSIISEFSTQSNILCTAEARGKPTTDHEFNSTVRETDEGQHDQNESSSAATPLVPAAECPVTPRPVEVSLPQIPPTTPTSTLTSASQRPPPLSPVTNRIPNTLSTIVRPLSSSPSTIVQSRSVEKPRPSTEPNPSPSVERSDPRTVTPGPDTACATGNIISAGAESNSAASIVVDQHDCVPFANPFFDEGKAPPKAHTEAEVELLRDLEEWCKEEVTEMVSTWMSVEKLMGYPARDAKGHKLDHKNRPDAVDYWLKCGRQNKPPALGDLDEYGDDVRVWWRGLQPEWRCEGDWPMSRVQPTGERWSRTAKGGLNGMLVLLMSLMWWRLRAKSEVEKGELLSVVEDVTWVLKAMHQQLENGGPMIEEMLERVTKAKKRGKENDGNAASAKKRRT